MAATKVPQVLDNNVTLTAGAGDHTSGIGTLTTGYGAVLHVSIQNGATGPTVNTQAQVWVSADNSNFYKLGGVLNPSIANAAFSSWTIPLHIGLQYVKVISGSNTSQNVTIRVEVSQVTAI